MDRHGGTFVEWYRRHERALAAGYLVVAAAVGAGFVLAPIRVRALDRWQAVVDWWDARWMRRLREGERLLASDDSVRANTYLARLDREHPATNVRHGRDKEREFILGMLGKSYERLGKSNRAIETYQRLVAFDSMHFRNHLALADASARLLSGWAEAPEAKDAYAAVLRIHPSHLPSVRGYIRYYQDRGEFLPIVAMYRTYLDAHLVQGVVVSVGPDRVTVPVLVDGRVHDYDLPLDGVADPAGVVRVETAGFAVRVERVALVTAARVGRAAPVAEMVLDASNPTARAMTPTDRAAFRPDGPDGALEFAVPGGAMVTRVRLRLALFKPIDRALWSLIDKSYANLLQEDARAAARARTVLFETAAQADSVMTRLTGANEGRVLTQAELSRR